MSGRIGFLLNRIGERLWVKPLVMCMLSIGGAIGAHAADLTGLGSVLPDISAESLATLLKVLSSSMLVIATFAVASMVSAYASASNTASPRAFSLVVADDVSQNALSAFIGAFIYSIVALVALENGYYGKAGRFLLFVLTAAVFAIVVLTFVRWVDRIARLGRLGNSIEKVEAAAARALGQRRLAPRFGCRPPGPRPDGAQPVHGEAIGYVQRIEVADLQAYAEVADLHVEVVSPPGSFTAPGRVLAWAWADEPQATNMDLARIAGAFQVVEDRTFDEDPRFGLIVLSEIACRALSPAVNDSGTAIDVIHTLVKLLAEWAEPQSDDEAGRLLYDRVAMPELELAELFEDAFRGIARDGAGRVEVVLTLLKGLESLTAISNERLAGQARQQARLVSARAERALEFPADLEAARAAARFAHSG